MFEQSSYIIYILRLLKHFLPTLKINCDGYTDHQLYLNNKIPEYISINNSINHLWKYNKIRVKRFLIHNFIIFILQFLIIINLTFQHPALPMYPPIGIAFIMFYLFGSNAFFGLLLSEFCGLFIHGLPINTICFYLFADLVAAWLMVYLSQNIFFLAIEPMVIRHKLLNFIKKILIACSISSLIKAFPIIITCKSYYNYPTLLYNYIDLWLADLNAILIMSSFVLSWIYIPFSQYNISHKKIKKSSIIALIFFIISSILFMKNIQLIYLIIINMIIAIYWAYYYGYLIATFLLFIVSSIYLTYFIAAKNQYLLYFGVPLYTLVGIILLLFIICMLYTSLMFDKKS